jgi:hyperosmotically inducible periplasmic protein
MRMTHWIPAGLGIVLVMGWVPCTSGAATADDETEAHSDSMRAAVSDTVITAKVKERLATDNRLGKASISVKTTNGVVTLTGNAPTHDAADAAEELADSVSGVKSVDNEIEAPSKLESAAGHVSDAAHKAHREVSDHWITTKIKAQLAADRSVERGSDITVKTDHGVVTLYGTASSRDAREHAEDVARHVKGVKSVDASGLHLASSE